ncbi:hypothetical protein CK203_017670 [Vitis vinifera]|uniref:DUF659 domain-containing protein n=1 Tax=Vitis vinifera TaxID=29760 RepID=A0A438JGU2_VITVI|nr:hypothetical protein CK203_017670 [Vitis vinifera]
MKPCNKVSEDARLECKESLANFKDQKTKRNELLQEIGMGPTSMHESALSKTIGTLGSGSGSRSGSVSGSGEPIPRGPMDKFTTSQPRQSTLNSKWKQEERKEVCRKIGRCCCKLWARVKPPSMHELRTWILKEEVNDLSIIMEDHKKTWKQYGCSIMSDGWTDGKSVEEIGEENVVQVITDNASNYVNAGMRLMEKRSRLWWTPCAAHCIDLMLEDIGKLNVHATTLSRARQVVKFIYGHTWTTVPLVSVLREVDSEERPAMGYIYELMDSAKEKIAFNCRGMERKYGPIWRKIDARWTPQLHRPLHAVGYYLNPQLRYGDKFSNVDEKSYKLVDAFWGSTPELQKFAIRVLSLTCSASGCERIGAHLNRCVIQLLRDASIIDHMVSSHSYKRKHNEVPSTSGGKGKEKELNLTPIDEDEDLDEMGIHDSGHFPTIDTLDEDEDDLGEEDLS